MSRLVEIRFYKHVKTMIWKTCPDSSKWFDMILKTCLDLSKTKRWWNTQKFEWMTDKVTHYDYKAIPRTAFDKRAVKNTYGSTMTENIHGPTTAKNIYGPSVAKNIYGPPMTKNIAAQVAPNSTNLDSLINRGKTKVKPRIAMVLLCLRIATNKIFKKRNSM